MSITNDEGKVKRRWVAVLAAAAAAAVTTLTESVVLGETLANFIDRLFS